MSEEWRLMMLRDSMKDACPWRLSQERLFEFARECQIDPHRVVSEMWSLVDDGVLSYGADAYVRLA